MSQNYKNHIRLIPLYHFLTFGIILASFIGALRNMIQEINAGRDIYNSSLILAITIALIFIFFFSRIFGLRAQDRAIRAEENFRHFIITGKPFDSRIRLGQIIALRFASDEELAALAVRAVNEKMTPKEIKMAIVNWRGDYHRV